MKLSRVHPGEWLVALCGVAVIVGLFLPWNDDASALSSPGFLDLLLLLVAVVAASLPLIVAGSSRTNVPIVLETTLWTVTLLLGLILLVKMIFPPDGGFESGFWLVLAGTLILGLSLWRSVQREN